MRFFAELSSRRSLLLGFLAATLIIFISPCQVFANGLPAGIGLFPGLLPIDFFSGPLLTVAVAIIERPFFARAGLTPWALIHSLRANFLSYLLGIVIALVYVSAVGSVIDAGFANAEVSFLGLPILLIVVTIWIEERLAVRVLAPGAKLRTRWIVVGNIVSNLALLLIGIVIGWILSLMGYQVHDFVLQLGEWCVAFAVAYLTIFVGAILLALGVPLWAVLPKSVQQRWGIPVASPDITSQEVSPATSVAEDGVVDSQSLSV